MTVANVTRSVSRLTRTVTLQRPGRTTPGPPASPLSTHPASGRGRPPQLDDREWLTREYRARGDKAIAKELGCAPMTVRRARVRMGIGSASPGARRGIAVVSSTQPSLAAAFESGGPTGMQILARFISESRTGGPAPSDQLLAARIRAYHEAKLHGDQLAAEDTLLDIASAAGLVHQHQRRLRRAA